MMSKFLTSLLSPTPQQQAQKELRNAQMALLEAERQAEYYKGLSNILRASIKRLELYTGEHSQ